VTYCFSSAKWLHESSSTLHYTFVACLVYYVYSSVYAGHESDIFPDFQKSFGVHEITFTCSIYCGADRLFHENCKLSVFVITFFHILLRSTVDLEVFIRKNSCSEIVKVV